MKRIFSVICLLFICTGPLFAQSVDISELRSAKRINFLNYRGPGKNSSTAREVESIGRALSRVSRANSQRSINVKYSIIRAVSANEKDKLSADIISIGKTARVDHIRNVRRIISGYLQTQYGYSEKEADTLAVFTTYYNAVYRKNMDYFSSKYKKVVLKYISKSDAGLSTKYFKWAGNTKIIIPVSANAGKGKIESINADTLSDKNVKREVNKDDSNLESRKELVDIKKKVVDIEKKDLKRKKEEINREKKEIARKEKAVEKKKADIAKEEKTIENKKTAIAAKKREAAAEPDAKKKEEKLREVAEEENKVKSEEENLKKEKSEVKEEEQAVSEKKEEVAKTEEKVKEKEKVILVKEENIKKEEKEIEKDQLKKDIKDGDPEAVEKLEEKADELATKEEELEKREDQLRDKETDKSVYALKMYYMKVNEYLKDGHYNNEMYMINATNGEVEFKSPVKNICGKKYDIFSRGVVVITNKGSHSEAHSLTLLDREKLEVVTTSEANVLWRSFVEIKEEFIYAIIIEGDDYYLGKFDKDLKLVNRSSEKINKDTFITFFKDNIFINRADKQIIMLKKSDLTLSKVIKPRS